MILLISLFTFTAMADASDNTIKPIPLTALKKNSKQYFNICEAVKNECKPEAVIWKEKNKNEFYLASPGPRLIKIKKVNNEYFSVNKWDFSMENNNKDILNNELTRTGIYIYPALYPLNKIKKAVALVSKWSVSYSGGGRQEEYANFLMINDNDSYQLAFKNVPFSSKEIIRACFTEDDYAKNTHCHDESWDILNLKILDKNKEFYSWKFITKMYSWPAFKEKNSIQVRSSEIVAYPFQQQPQSNN